MTPSTGSLFSGQPGSYKLKEQGKDSGTQTPLYFQMLQTEVSFITRVKMPILHGDYCMVCSVLLSINIS